MKICAFIGCLFINKPMAYVYAIVAIYALGGMTAHVPARGLTAACDWCSDKWTGLGKRAATAFRLDPSKESDLQEIHPKAVLVDGIITPDGQEQYFLDDGSVLPPPEGSEAENWQVNLPAH